MTPRIRVAPAAAKQIRTAADWWRMNRPSAPEQFADEVERAFDLVHTLPGIGEPVQHRSIIGIRRLHLARVRYHLFYLVRDDEDAVDILALWHTSRGRPPKL